MKKCSLDNFIEELKPWLSSDYLHKAVSDGQGNFIIHFLDGTKNSYSVNDCNRSQVNKLINDLKKSGVRVDH